MTDDHRPEDAPARRDEVAAEPAEAPGDGSERLRETRPEIVRRSPTGIIVAAVVLLAIAAIGLWVWTSVMRPDPRELLGEVVAKYAGADHIHTESTIAYEMSMGGQSQKMDMPTTAWFSQPNLMHYETGDGMQQTRAVCDGEHLYLEVGMFSGAVRLPAPDALGEMPLEDFGIGGGGMGAFPLPDARSMISGDFDVETFASVEYGIDESNEWLASLEAPCGTWALTARPHAGPPVTLWIDRAERVVRKFAVEINYDALVGHDEEAAAAVEQLPENMREMFRQMEMRFDVDVQTVELDTAPPEGTYAYEPEEGIEVVDATSFREGIAALMGSGMDEMPEMPEETDLTGKEPPAFTAQDLQGRDVPLGDFRGKPLVLDFWATWCPPCLRELPILNELHAEYADQGLQIVAVSSDRSLAEVTGFLEETKLDFTVLWLPPDREREVSEAYGITGIPRTLYIDADWTVRVDDTGLHEKSHMLDSLEAIGGE